MRNAPSARARIVRLGRVPSVAGCVRPILKELRDELPNLNIEISDLPNARLSEAVRRGSVGFGIGIEERRVWPPAPSMSRS